MCELMLREGIKYLNLSRIQFKTDNIYNKFQNYFEKL